MVVPMVDIHGVRIHFSHMPIFIIGMLLVLNLSIVQLVKNMFRIWGHGWSPTRIKFGQYKESPFDRVTAFCEFEKARKHGFPNPCWSRLNEGFHDFHLNISNCWSGFSFCKVVSRWHRCCNLREFTRKWEKQWRSNLSTSYPRDSISATLPVLASNKIQPFVSMLQIRYIFSIVLLERCWNHSTPHTQKLLS